MLLNYPPATIINLYQKFNSQAEREKERLKSILRYLKNDKVVNDEDLLLIVDGHDTWFQLPSEVIIRQYQNVLDDANKRLLSKYGINGKGTQNFNQTIVFGAEKVCEGEDMACKYVPQSMLPENIYGKETGKKVELSPAKYLDSGMLMGPAKDLRAMYDAAVKKLEDENSQSATVQSVFATMFGEQQLARDASVQKEKERPASTTSKWLDWFGGSAAEPQPEQEQDQDATANITLQKDQQYEFFIGLDYTHSLFQPFIYCAEDELVALPHDNSTDLDRQYHYDGTPTPPLKIPTALEQARPPFWATDWKKNPSPNEKTSYIDKLEFKEDLDDLKPRDTSWADLNLIQNTYTGAIPAVLHLNNPVTPPQSRSTRRRIPDSRAHSAPSANITWSSLWFAGYERALLRKHFRTRQSPIGYHSAAVGGDRMWDQRGGRGGVWTEKEAIWLPWGEVDGVCGTLKQIKEVFDDGKGVWLHEKEKDAEKERLKEEEELAKKIEEAKQKERERKEEEEKEKKKQEAKQRIEGERKKKEGEKGGHKRRWIA